MICQGPQGPPSSAWVSPPPGHLGRARTFCVLMGALLAAGPGPRLLVVKGLGGRGSKVQGFVCVLKGPLLGDNSPRGWALSSGLLAGSWVWGCRRPSVLNTGHLARAACAPGHKCPCRGRGPPAAPAGGHPRALWASFGGWCLGGLFARCQQLHGLFPVCDLAGRFLCRPELALAGANCLVGSENAGPPSPGPGPPALSRSLQPLSVGATCVQPGGRVAPHADSSALPGGSLQPLSLM